MMSKTKERTITKKLTRMNMLVSGAALLMACLSFVTYDLFTFREAIARNLSIQARVAGSNSVTALVFSDPHSAENTLSALKAAPNVMSAGIYSLNGQLFASYQRDPQAQLPPTISLDKGHGRVFKDGNVVVTEAIVFQGKPTGIVYIRSDLQALNTQLRRYASIAAGVLIASLWTALMLSSMFRRSITDPIVHLADVAHIVSRDKNYNVRATPPNSRDEIATLIESFNQMLVQIQERDAALQSARDQLEQRVDERTFQLAAANKELESFSYSVSHDLRTPLRAIDGFSHALLEDSADRLDDTDKEHLNRIRAATQRMGSLIDDLLNLSRLSRTEMHTQSVDISALASSIAHGLLEVLPRRLVELRIKDGLRALADPGLLRVVLENLLGNAWKFTSKRESALIEFGAAVHNGTPAFFVRDDGAGFDPAYADRLFGAFQRLHSMTEFAGTGIGLATVQRIVHRHGGQIWAESAVGRGATFYFTLGETAFEGAQL
jgi:signal transduction histidine kinase